MVRRTECYADTSAFIAFLDRSDSYHPLFARLFAAPPPLVTSALVVAEGHGWFLRRYDARRAIEFFNFLNALPMLEVVGFDSAQLRCAARYVKKYEDQSLTLADAHGLALMNTRRIQKCWSTDRHLAIEGAALAIH